MNFIKQIERIQLINKLIISESTGTPDELAIRLNISKRQLYNHIESLKNLGADIVYDKVYKTYYYTDRRIKIDFHFEVLSSEVVMKTDGGFLLKESECNFISLCESTLVAC
ncbi:hypothetical protein BFP72_15210 [Reichenbachiella sp. 5M10]|uniref:HTH domain-containing protein n=1 Tax=Reichenbachiella sp. 5M10 TaxID=1889772 RepID=UPI000C14D614|nr:helix-turn-helix domain-containing protein [Reichenbachiella sp. 5M10]PIB36653.1 hypothetical protein BFP72_15210 [Reichenbachiella sp. 5M10]